MNNDSDLNLHLHAECRAGFAAVKTMEIPRKFQCGWQIKYIPGGTYVTGGLCKPCLGLPIPPPPGVRLIITTAV